ncbi:DUF6207 family protein [Streptomyces sp. MA5143a]|nr:DUF6207 family protein [Streptomyces sp. MA5143a]
MEKSPWRRWALPPGTRALVGAGSTREPGEPGVRLRCLSDLRQAPGP